MTFAAISTSLENPDIIYLKKKFQRSKRSKIEKTQQSSLRFVNNVSFIIAHLTILLAKHWRSLKISVYLFCVRLFQVGQSTIFH